MELFAETGIPEFDISHVGRFQSGQDIHSGIWLAEQNSVPESGAQIG